MKYIGIPSIRLPLFLRVVALYAVFAVAIPPLITPDTDVKAAASYAPPKPRVPPVKFHTSTRVSGKPVRITLPRLGIDLSVITGEYDAKNDAWTLTDDKAQFADVTELPNNESGNTFVYGHNTAAVFAPLAYAQSGDEAIVRTSNGKSFRYIYSDGQLVDPKATSVLDQSETPILTLMTCEGIFSEARRIVVFKFKDVI